MVLLNLTTMAIHLENKPIDAVCPDGCGRVMYSQQDQKADPLRCGTKYAGPDGIRRRVLCFKCDRSNRAYALLSSAHAHERRATELEKVACEHKKGASELLQQMTDISQAKEALEVEN